MKNKKIRYPWFKQLNYSKDYFNSILHAINNSKMSMGLATYKLENKLKKILNVKHVILTTSGTSALTMASIALGINHKTTVICPDLTWIATINPAKILGAKIILCDSKKNSQLVCFKTLNSLIRKYKPFAVYLAHLNGDSTYDLEFNQLKKKMGFHVIEDAAQAMFVKSEDNQYCGTKYEIGCFSMSITKLIHMVYGGFCSTNSDELAKKLITIRNNGVQAKPEYAKMELATYKGLNFKPSDLHSRIGLINLKSYRVIIKKAKKIYSLYFNKLKNSPSIKFLGSQNKKSIPLYVLVTVKNRKNFINYCNRNRIEIHYATRSLHETGLFNFNKRLFKNSSFVSKNILRLPSGPGYSLNEIHKIAEILQKYPS